MPKWLTWERVLLAIAVAGFVINYFAPGRDEIQDGIVSELLRQNSRDLRAVNCQTLAVKFNVDQSFCYKLREIELLQEREGLRDFSGRKR